MSVKRRSGLISAGALAMAALAAVSAAWTSATPARSALDGWTSLTLTASKALIFSANTTLKVSEGVLPGDGKPAVVFKTNSEARILGASGFREETTSYIDRATQRPVEFFQLRPGDNARRFRFLEGVVRQTLWEPPPSQRDSDFADWHEVETIDRKLTFADGTSPRPEDPLTDFYSLIYLLRDIDLSTQAPKEFNTLYRKHIVRVRVIPGEVRDNQREVVNEATGAKETLKLRERRISIKPIGQGAESFRGILGMQGDTEIWIDEASGALLEVDGDAPGLGATEVLLASYRR
jgi:hypothetical protein